MSSSYNFHIYRGSNQFAEMQIIIEWMQAKIDKYTGGHLFPIKLCLFLINSNIKQQMTNWVQKWAQN